MVGHSDEAFYDLLRYEDVLAKAKTELKKAEILFGNEVSAAETDLANAWDKIKSYMAETGEYELEFPAPAGQRYVVNWSTARQSVKVTDIEALPEELVKVEKKPKLKEIGDKLKEGWMTNAAKFELGESHLQWRIVKEKKNA